MAASRDSSIDEQPERQQQPLHPSPILAPAIDWPARAGRADLARDVRKRAWSDWEIRYAQEHDKRIVGVYTQERPTATSRRRSRTTARRSSAGRPTASSTRSAATSTIGTRPTAAELPERAISRVRCQTALTLYSYVVGWTSDSPRIRSTESAPLATCKPDIRTHREDHQLDHRHRFEANDLDGRLVYAMRVTEALRFDEYWRDERFRDKRPISTAAACRRTATTSTTATRDGEWRQENSHHSLKDGCRIRATVSHDTQTDRILISDHFTYWGAEGPARYRRTSAIGTASTSARIVASNAGSPRPRQRVHRLARERLAVRATAAAQPSGSTGLTARRCEDRSDRR